MSTKRKCVFVCEIEKEQEITSIYVSTFICILSLFSEHKDTITVTAKY